MNHLTSCTTLAYHNEEEADIPDQEDKLIQQLTQWIKDARPTEKDEDEYDDDFETNA